MPHSRNPEEVAQPLPKPYGFDIASHPPPQGLHPLLFCRILSESRAFIRFEILAFPSV